MPIRPVEASRLSAQNAIDYVKEFQMTAITHPRFATLTNEERTTIIDKMQRHLDKARTVVVASQTDAKHIEKELSSASKKAMEQFNTLKDVTPSQVKPSLDAGLSSTQAISPSVKPTECFSMSPIQDTIASSKTEMEIIDGLKGVTPLSKSVDSESPKCQEEEKIVPQKGI